MLRRVNDGVRTIGREAAATARTAWSATALLVSLAVVCGVLAGSIVPLPSAVAMAAMPAGLIVVALGRRQRRVWLPALLVVALSVGLWRYDATLPPGSAAGLPYYIGRDVTLAGTVAAEPEPLDRGENLRLSVETLTVGKATRRIGGLVLVHLAALSNLSYGDRISLAGTLAPPPELQGSSPGSYRAYLASQGIYTVLNYPRMQRLGAGGGSPLLALAIALRQLLEGGIRRILPGPEAALLFGILLGVRTRALGDLTAAFVKTGMIHIVAISGLKVSLVVGTADRLAKRWLGPRRSLPPTLLVLVLYVLVTGATPAGLRSAVMWTLALLALRFGRRSDAVTSLALAAALLALVSPRILWDLGFQLSVAGTVGIVLLESDLERWLRLPPIFRETAAVTLSAQIGTLPLQAAGFGQISLLSPLSNTLLLPLLPPILILGLPAALAGALLPSLGTILGWLVYPLLALTIAVLQMLVQLPFAVVLTGPWPSTLVVGYYVLLGLAALLLSRDRHETLLPHVHVPLRPAVFGAMALGLATVAWQVPRPIYTLSVLDLGRGQALLLTTPAGHTILIDGADKPSLLAAALSARLPFWRSRLDLLVSSDTDLAHVGGLRGITAYYQVGQALDPGAVYPSASYATWRAELRDAGVPERKLRTGARYYLDRACYLDALLPYALNPDAAPQPVALRLVLGRFSLLLLNRGALVADSTTLLADGARNTTALVLPAGANTPSDYTTLLHVLHPRLVILPSTADARDDPNADTMAKQAARASGARPWQGGDGATLQVTTDGARYMVQG